MFNFFKKKDEDEQQASFDPANITVENLNIGFVFDYELSTWEVIESYEYIRDNGSKSKEFKIKNAYEIVYLTMEKDEDLKLSIMERIEAETLLPEISSLTQTSDTPPESFQYQNEKFVLKAKYTGVFKDLSKKTEAKLSTWLYASTKKTIVELNRWTEGDFKASIGREISAHLITNILHVKKSS